MAAYADWTYYTTGYLLGRAAVVPETEFPFWINKATTEIDRLTFGQAAAEAATSPVKDATCEVAEFLYTASLAFSGEAGGVLTSFSNDGQSGSYDRTQTSGAGKADAIRRIAKSHLAGTGLMRGGVELWHG